MALQTIWHKVTLTSLLVILSSLFLPLHADENNSQLVNASNFGLPGIIDLPTAQRFPDGELVVTQQLHKSLRVLHFKHIRVAYHSLLWTRH